MQFIVKQLGIRMLLNIICVLLNLLNKRPVVYSHTGIRLCISEQYKNLTIISLHVWTRISTKSSKLFSLSNYYHDHGHLSFFTLKFALIHIRVCVSASASLYLLKVVCSGKMTWAYNVA